MLKTAGIEMTKVSDSESGKKIYISTTARLAFRKAWPKKAGVRNHILNDFIANMFAGGSEAGHFKPRTGGGSGKVREVQGGRFIAIESEDSMKVIAIKGSVPELPELPESYKPPSLGGTSLSDNKEPEAGAGAGAKSAPVQMDLGLPGPEQPKHHIVPAFPGGQMAPTAPPAAPPPTPPPAPAPAPAAPVPAPTMPTPAAVPPAMPATPEAGAPAPEAPAPGMFERLKRFIGLQR